MFIFAQQSAFAWGTGSALMPGTKREKTEPKITVVTPMRNAPRMMRTVYRVIVRFSKQFPRVLCHFYLFYLVARLSQRAEPIIRGSPVPLAPGKYLLIDNSLSKIDISFAKTRDGKLALSCPSAACESGNYFSARRALLVPPFYTLKLNRAKRCDA